MNDFQTLPEHQTPESARGSSLGCFAIPGLIFLLLGIGWAAFMRPMEDEQTRVRNIWLARCEAKHASVHCEFSVAGHSERCYRSAGGQHLREEFGQAVFDAATPSRYSRSRPERPVLDREKYYSCLDAALPIDVRAPAPPAE